MQEGMQQLGPSGRDNNNGSFVTREEFQTFANRIEALLLRPRGVPRHERGSPTVHHGDARERIVQDERPRTTPVHMGTGSFEALDAPRFSMNVRGFIWRSQSLIIRS